MIGALWLTSRAREAVLIWTVIRGGGVELLPQPTSEIIEADKRVEITAAAKRFIIPPEGSSRSAVRTVDRSVVGMHVEQFFFTTCLL
jgi:hypothetical protein